MGCVNGEIKIDCHKFLSLKNAPKLMLGCIVSNCGTQASWGIPKGWCHIVLYSPQSLQFQTENFLTALSAQYPQARNFPKTSPSITTVLSSSSLDIFSGSVVSGMEKYTTRLFAVELESIFSESSVPLLHSRRQNRPRPQGSGLPYPLWQSYSLHTASVPLDLALRLHLPTHFFHLLSKSP